MNNFLKIHPVTLIPGALGKFKIFYGTQSGKPVLYTSEGEILPADKLQKASKWGTGITWYILTTQRLLYQEYIEAHLNTILSKPGLDDALKQSIITEVSNRYIEAHLDEIIKSQDINANQKTEILKTVSPQILEKNIDVIINDQEIDPQIKAEVFVRVAGPIQASFKSSSVLRQVEPQTISRLELFAKNIIQFISNGATLSLLIDTIKHNSGVYEHVLKVLCYFSSFMRYLDEVAKNGLVDFMTPPDKLEFEKCVEAKGEHGFPGGMNENYLSPYLIECCKGAFLHDIGKNLIPNEILDKNGPLDSVEYEKVKAHPANAIIMLSCLNLPRFVLDTITYHHENDDGSGYPLGVAKKDIPFPARVIHIVDVFEALTSDRPYKDALSVYDALKIMVGENGVSSKREDRNYGMRHCFDLNLIQHFIPFLKNINLL